jgi:ribosomal protein L7/L12
MEWLRRLFGGRKGEAARARRPAPAPVAPAASAEVVALLRAGRKIEAIKRYRQEHPDVALREAKAVVDALERGAGRRAAAGAAPAAARAEVAALLAAVCEIEAVRRLQRQYGEVGPAEARAVVAALEWGLRHPDAPVAPPGEIPEIVTLVRARRPVLAIKAYRERHPGLGLREAKAAVEALAVELGVVPEPLPPPPLPPVSAPPLPAPPAGDDAAGAPALPAEVEALARAGRTIEAVMRYRERYPQVALGEAMDRIGALERRLRA